MASACRWFDLFLEASQRVAFLDPVEYGERIAFRYNSDSILMFREYVRLSPSLRGSHEGPNKAGTIGAYASAILKLAVAVAKQSIVAAESPLTADQSSFPLPHPSTHSPLHHSPLTPSLFPIPSPPPSSLPAPAPPSP